MTQYSLRTTPVSKNAYLTDNLVGVIGCAEQYAICEPTGDKCSPWLGQNQLANYIDANTMELDDA